MHTLLALLLNVLLIVLCFSLVGALTLYLLWYYERNHGGHVQPLPGSTPGSLRMAPSVLAILLEALGFAVIVLTYPLRLIHDLVPHRVQAPGENPVLLVHGWGANSACFLALQLWLKWRGHKNVFAVSYTPPVIDAVKLSGQLARHINAALAATGAQKVTIVAHSMGGLLSRYAIKNLGMEDKVDRVISIGSPHMGSKLAGVLPGAGNIPQMRFQSDFVRELADGGLTPGSQVQYFSIYSEFDNFVLPAQSSVLDGAARNLHVPYHGHCALLFSPKVFLLVEDCLKADAPLAVGAR